MQLVGSILGAAFLRAAIPGSLLGHGTARGGATTLAHGVTQAQVSLQNSEEPDEIGRKRKDALFESRLLFLTQDCPCQGLKFKSVSKLCLFSVQIEIQESRLGSGGFLAHIECFVCPLLVLSFDQQLTGLAGRESAKGVERQCPSYLHAWKMLRLKAVCSKVRAVLPRTLLTC